MVDFYTFCCYEYYILSSLTKAKKKKEHGGFLKPLIDLLELIFCHEITRQIKEEHDVKALFCLSRERLSRDSVVSKV